MRSVRIPLTQGQFAIIDREDLEKVRKYKWHVQKISGKYYAAKGDINGTVRLHRFVMNASGKERVRFIRNAGLDCRKGNLLVRAIKELSRKPFKRKRLRVDIYGKIKTKYGVKVKVPLTKNLYAIVDQCDLPLIRRYTWRIQKHRDTHLAVTMVTTKVNGRTRKKLLMMHRLIAKPRNNQDVDHWNHDGLNNTRRNLRRCSKFENQQNRRKHKTSIYKGITQRGSRWEASIAFYKNKKYLGTFGTSELAARAYDEAAKRYHGEFACLNFPVNR